MSDGMAAEQGTILLTPGRHRGLLRAALPIHSLPLLPEAVASSAVHQASLPAMRQAQRNHTTMHEGWHTQVADNLLPVMGAYLIPWCASVAASLPEQEQ